MMFQRYQSLPRKVDAVQFTDENKDMIFNEIKNVSAYIRNNEPVLSVKTCHGEIAIVRIGDWIVKDSEPNTYYPVKDKIFRENYV